MLGPLIVPPLESAIRNLRGSHYKFYAQREEVHTNFVESWKALQGNLHRLAPVSKTLAHYDPERKKVLKELEKATKRLRKINKRLMSCKPIKRALREQENTEKLFMAFTKRISDGGEVEQPEVGQEEESTGKRSMADPKKIADMLGHLVVGGKVEHPQPELSPPSTPPSPPFPSPLAEHAAPRAEAPSPFHLQIITQNYRHRRKHKSKSKTHLPVEDEGYLGDHTPSPTPLRSHGASPTEPPSGHGQGSRRFCHRHRSQGEVLERFCSPVVAPSERRHYLSPGGGAPVVASPREKVHYVSSEGHSSRVTRSGENRRYKCRKQTEQGQV